MKEIENEIGQMSNLTLPELAAAIKAELNKLDRKRIGLLLIEAKKHEPHGGFMKWVRDNVPEINHRTATRWMELAGASPAKERKPVNVAKRTAAAQKRAVELVAKMSPNQARNCEPEQAREIVKLFAPIAKMSVSVKSWGTSALVSLAEQVVDWRKATPKSGNVPSFSDQECTALKKASEILATLARDQERQEAA